MHQGKLVFAQLMSDLQLPEFHRYVKRYDKSRERLTFSYLDQFLCMAFAQLTYRESLRDIEACLRAHKAKLYHLGIRGGIARSTLADANENRDWRIFQDCNDPQKWTIFSRNFDRVGLNQKGRANEEKDHYVSKTENRHRSLEGRYDHPGACLAV